MSEMTSLSMTSLSLDLNGAAKCVDAAHNIASPYRAQSSKYKMATTFGLTYEKSCTYLWRLKLSQLVKSSQLVFGRW